MKKMYDYLQSLGVKKIYFFALFFAVALLVAGFVVPPTGVIDRSVLIGVAEIILMVDVPIVITIIATHKLKLSADLDDKTISISSDEEENK